MLRMSDNWRWDPCVSHRAQEAIDFVTDYFVAETRSTHLVCGAGFDPRATGFCELLRDVPKLSGIFFREERPNSDPELVLRAEHNCNQMQMTIPNSTVESIDVFASDGAVIGGREAVKVMTEKPLKDYTDVVVDVSALSVGIAFPLIKYLLDESRNLHGTFNVHVVSIDTPAVDQSISSIAADRAEYVAGFRGTAGIDEQVDAVKLWLPQLVVDRHMVLEKLREAIDPDEICPILPFPCSEARRADELIEHYANEFESTWGIDSRSIIYADERNPIDLYRTILRIDEARRSVFEGVGGSELILSPAGSKALSIGAMMAAIERNFPVRYVETLSYSLDESKLDAIDCPYENDLLHVWLSGDAYS